MSFNQIFYEPLISIMFKMNVSYSLFKISYKTSFILIIYSLPTNNIVVV